MAEIINLTPHSIIIPGCSPPHGDAPADWTLPPSGLIARAETKSTPADPIDGIPTSHLEYGALVDVPDPRDGVYLVVSAICVMAARAQGRSVDDLLVPGDQIRDSAGRVIGCRSLARQGGMR